MFKSLVLAVSLCSICLPALAVGHHHVKGHVKQDGTYVAPSNATNPDSTLLNNWSTQGNYNPYTGQAGTVNPYAVPAYQYQAPAATYQQRQPYQPYSVYQPYQQPSR